ncbi:MAG: cell division protein SepF [Nanoarchaeota archaeon]|nr:cell division protein SepF [Nanoarchaeota archaeon]
MAINFKDMFGKGGSNEDEYVELDLDSVAPPEKKVIVKPFVLRDYDGMEEILNSLRTGYTIAVIDIKPLKSKDIIELKRAISKIKKTVDALEGTIAGFGDNVILATPQFAHIHKPTVPVKKTKDSLFG